MKRLLFFTLCCVIALSVVAQGTRPVRGVVFDNNGAPMSGVKLTAVGSTDSKESGADGTFEMMVSPYTKHIEASKEGYISAQAEVDGSYLVFKLQVDKKYAENKAKAEAEARLAAERAAEAERARIAAERAEAEKAERERLAEEERKRVEEERRIAAERAAAEKAERERLAEEERKRVEEERRIAAERAAAERAERERLAEEERKRVEEERRIAAERAAAEKAERKRKAEEQKRQLEEERKRIEEERRIAAERAEAERAANERVSQEAAKKSAAEKALAMEQARLEQERLKEQQRQALQKQREEQKAALLREKEQKAETKRAKIAKWQQATLKGYRSMVEFAFMMDSDLMPSYNLHYIGGYQINNYLYVGAGTGIMLHESGFANRSAEWSKQPQEHYLPLNVWNIPVFAYFRANFMDRRCAPYFAVAAGYRFSANNYFIMPWQRHDYYNTCGLLINPQLGVNFRMTKRADVYLAAGFNMQQMPVFNANKSTMFVASFEKKFYYGFDLRLGFTF